MTRNPYLTYSLRSSNSLLYYLCFLYYLCYLCYTQHLTRIRGAEEGSIDDDVDDDVDSVVYVVARGVTVSSLASSMPRNRRYSRSSCAVPTRRARPLTIS